MSVQRWEHFHHQADIGVRGIGRTISEAFEQVALALTAVITVPKKVKPLDAISIQCEAPDHELLLFDWLNALIYEMMTRRMLFSRFEVTIEKICLQATLWGESISNKRHQPAVEVKGATFTELRIVKTTEGLWLAQCIVDV
ncbi:MAG: archease [Desulfobacterales bacterium]|nr:archease [Desulfobacterales bacterium]